jgi:hypothetical protein
MDGMFKYKFFCVEISVGFGRASIRKMCGSTAEFEDADVGSVQLSAVSLKYGRMLESLYV